MNERHNCVIPLLLLCFASSAASAVGQEVQWRRNYDAAVREAKETGKPLFLDFGTVNCYWCKRLDATTFRDPNLVRILNTRFVPTKVEAEREPKLVNYLGIQSYPTLVLASPTLKILTRHEGYGDSRQCDDLIKQALGRLAQLAEASPPPQPKIRAQNNDEEPAAPSATRTTVSPPEPTDGDSERIEVARELLERARQEFRAGQWKRPLERCRILHAGYADLPEGEAARGLAIEIQRALAAPRGPSQ